MRRKYFWFSVALLCISIIALLLLTSTNNSIEKQIIEKDSTFTKIIHTYNNDWYTYAFYTTSSDSVGLALKEEDGDKLTHLFGHVPINSNDGFTYGSQESKQLGQYVLYGVITNAQITEVTVNEDLSNLIKIENGKYLWFYQSNKPFQSTSIAAQDSIGNTLFATKLYG
ncbi:MAG: hypothetical protein ACE3L7_23160 [Candidatus Pristimantibacillus sp.]